MKLFLPGVVRVFAVATVACFLVLTKPSPIFAVISSCTADVSPNSVSAGSSPNFNFTVTNSDSKDVVWMKVTQPSSDFDLVGFTTGGWTNSGSASTSDVTLTGGTLSAGGRYSLTISVNVGSSVADSKDWSVQVSDDPGGASAFSCSGTLGTAITASTAPAQPPQISDIVVSDISDSQAKITWTTDLSSNSSVDYGTSDAYGSTATGESGATSHSVTLSNLSANTLYHYNVKSADSGGNTGESGDNTFTTAISGSTAVTVTGSVTTVTRIVGPTPTPTPVPDTFPPIVKVSTDFTKAFTKAPTIEGTSADPSSVAKLEYSLDDGRNWSAVDVAATIGSRRTAFSFTPVNLLDDNYQVSIRATDGKGNSGETKAGTLIIDRLPPMVGSNIMTIGPQILHPSPAGDIVVLSGMDTKITLSAVGGPVKIEIQEGDEAEQSVQIPLVKNPDNGLWSGMVHFGKPGTYTVKTQATDGAGNYRERALHPIVVIPNGQISDGGSAVTRGTITAYYLDTISKEFVLWDGRAYGQQNPQEIDGTGGYHEYLPGGTYYLRVTAPGYQTLETSIFTIDSASPVTTNFTLTRARAIQIGPWLIPLPDFRQTTADVRLTAVSGPGENGLTVSQTEFPYFSYPMGSEKIISTGFRGKPTIVTFLNTWSPDTTAQLAILNDLVSKKEINLLAIVPQETAASVAIFRKRGGYVLPIIADPDGAFVDPLHIETVPTHIFLNRKGIIQHVLTGILLKEELLDTLVQ